MANASIIGYNSSKSLKDIIGEVNEYYSDIPDKSYIGPGLHVNENMFLIKITNNQTNEHKTFSKSRVCIKISLDKINVFYKQYYCSLSHTFINNKDMCRLSKKCILDEYKISDNCYWSDSRKNVPIISLLGYPDIYFVFNIKNIHKNITILNKCQLNQKSLPIELVDNIILPFLGHNIKDNCLEYECEYKEKFPEIISIAQLKKLYELGIVKMVKKISNNINDKSFKNQYYILSDDAFDNEPDGVIKNLFNTKEEMHVYIKTTLQKLNIDKMIASVCK